MQHARESNAQKKVALQFEVMPGAKVRDCSSIDFKVIFHDSLPKQSCAIQRQAQQPFDNSTKESSLVSGLAAVHRFYEDRNMLVAATIGNSSI